MGDAELHPQALITAGLTFSGSATVLFALWTLPLFEGGWGLRSEGVGQALGEMSLMPIATIGTLGALAGLLAVGCYVAGIQSIYQLHVMHAGVVGAAGPFGYFLYEALAGDLGWAFGMYLALAGSVVMLLGATGIEVSLRYTPSILGRREGLRSLLEPQVVFFVPVEDPMSTSVPTPEPEPPPASQPRPIASPPPPAASPPPPAASPPPPAASPPAAPALACPRCGDELRKLLDGTRYRCAGCGLYRLPDQV